MKKKGSCLKYVLSVVVILGVAGIFLNQNDFQSTQNEIVPTSEAQTTDNSEIQGVTGIEVQKSASEQYGVISDFDYEISGNYVMLDSYDGKCKILEIKPSYDIDGTEYTVDLSNFQVKSNSVETLILDEGITGVMTSIFNSCDVKSVYFPKSITNVYDYTLSYLHPDEGNTIKIYYGGTQDEWSNIFTEYKRTKVEDAEFGEEMGTALADKINEMIGSEYDSSLFEYFFSANPDDLKKG